MKIEDIARICHETNRAYCQVLGDNSQVPWEEAPAWQRESCIQGVHGVLAGNSPAESHAGWMRLKHDEGWTYGPVKDVEKKTHPCLVPYDELPVMQQVKDQLFVALARRLLTLEIECEVAKTWQSNSP